MKNKANSFGSVNTTGTAVDGVTTNTAQSINDTLSKGKILKSDIEDRLKLSKNQKIADRVKVFLDKFDQDPDYEDYLMHIEGDFLNLINGTDDSLLSVYPSDWKVEDFIEIYNIIYGEAGTMVY